MNQSITRESLQQAIHHLPEETLAELAQFIDLLQSRHKTTWPPDFFKRIIGGWQGEALERPDQGQFEERDVLL